MQVVLTPPVISRSFLGVPFSFSTMHRVDTDMTHVDCCSEYIYLFPTSFRTLFPWFHFCIFAAVKQRWWTLNINFNSWIVHTCRFNKIWGKLKKTCSVLFSLLLSTDSKDTCSRRFVNTVSQDLEPQSLAGIYTFILKVPGSLLGILLV